MANLFIRLLSKPYLDPARLEKVSRRHALQTKLHNLLNKVTSGLFNTRGLVLAAQHFYMIIDPSSLKRRILPCLFFNQA